MCVGGSGGMRDGRNRVLGCSKRPWRRILGSGDLRVGPRYVRIGDLGRSGTLEPGDLPDGTRQPRIEERLKALDEQHGTTWKVRFLTFNN